MSFRPLGKRVLLQRTKVEEKTASGIILVDSAKEKPNTAEVKAFGADIFFDDQDVHLENTSKVAPSAKVPYKTDSILSNI